MNLHLDWIEYELLEKHIVLLEKKSLYVQDALSMFM